MRRLEGVVIGLVKEIDASLGRIKVEFPWLQESYRSGWAPIAVPLAGQGRGAFIMPEIDDEALIAFEHGDFEHPFVVGFLWNGVDKPPSSDINASVRRLRTPSGHVVEFDDRPGQEKILIKTKGGHTIELQDTPLPHVAIQTKGGQEVTLSDTPPSISISTQTGVVNVTCTLANVTANGALSVSAPLAQFSGVVQATTVIATSVVSSTYTPGLGNIFGL